MIALVLVLALQAPALPPPPAVRTLLTPDLTCRVRSKAGQLVRSQSRRSLFLRMLGYSDGKAPAGFVVDHLVPLTCGGCDLPANLSLLPVAEWRTKSGWERQPCAAWWDGTNTRLLQRAISGEP